MEAKLKYELLDFCNKIYEKNLRKEQTQDCVVPDTLPDIASVLHTAGCLLIRSKDTSPGRVKLEANIPAKVVFLAEDGGVFSMEVNVPVFLSAEDEAISQDCSCTAELKLISLETRLLNPRKVLLRAEVSGEIACYAPGSLACPVAVEEGEHIHTRSRTRRMGFVSAVSEKTFAITDEQPLPAGMEAGDILCADVEVFADDVKQVHSRMIVKGRIKSSLLLREEDRLVPLELSTDFSQIMEWGGAEADFARAWMIPSGIYHYISAGEGEKRLCLEAHLVTQLLCRESRELQLLDDAYSNEYTLECGFETLSCREVSHGPILRADHRQLWEIRDMGRYLCCGHSWGSPRSADDRLLLPLSLNCLYLDGEGRPRCEKLETELEFENRGGEDRRLELCPPELMECSLSSLPGGVELRLTAQARSLAVSEINHRCLKSLEYDESSPEDISRKPSLTLLKATSGDDLWTLARENCSTVEAIVEANRLDESGENWEKLLLIPKSL